MHALLWSIWILFQLIIQGAPIHSSTNEKTNGSHIQEPGADFLFSLCHMMKHNISFTADCSSKHLSTVPECQDNCSLVTRLNMSFNCLAAIDNETFANFTRLLLLDLSSNCIHKIDADAFRGLSLLENLTLFKNMATTTKKCDVGKCLSQQSLDINEFALQHLLSLKHLTISYNHFQDPVKFFIKTLCHLNSSLETLELNYIRRNTFCPVNFDRKTSHCLSHLPLKNLSLDYNYIYNIDAEVVEDLLHLEHLSVRDNYLGGAAALVLIVLPMLVNLTYLDLSCQRASKLCKRPFLDEETPNFPYESICFGDWKTGIQQNVIRRKDSHSLGSTDARKYGKALNIEEILEDKSTTQKYINLSAFENLKEAHLTNINAHIYSINFTLLNTCWLQSPIEILDVSYLIVDNVIGTVPCLNNLRNLTMRGLEATHVDPELFHDLSKLEVLLMGYNSVSKETFARKDSTKLFMKNRLLRVLELSNLKIHKLIKGIFDGLDNLETLDLSGNHIISIAHLGLFKNLANLLHLNLSDNKISYFPCNETKLLQSNQKRRNMSDAYIDITENALVCSCANLEALTTFVKTPVRITHLNDTLQCSSANGTKIKVFYAEKRFRNSCQQVDDTPMVFLCIIYPGCLMMILIISILHCYRWRIQYVWYQMKHFLDGNLDSSYGFQKQFDAYISTSDERIPWVEKWLLPNLEKSNHRYKLCLPYRDFQPGQSIFTSITECIQESKAMLLLITKRSLKSRWCDLELREARVHYLHQGPGAGKIIAILFPGVTCYVKMYHPEILTLLRMVPCLQWTEHADGQYVFWMRLQRELGRSLSSAAST